VWRLAVRYASPHAADGPEQLHHLVSDAQIGDAGRVEDTARRLGVESMGMAEHWRVSENVVPICPHCQADLAFVCSWPSPGVWGYEVVRTYECPTHGPIFITPETRATAVSAERRTDERDGGDYDSLSTVRPRPKPLLNADAVAVPVPDPERDSH